MEIAAGTSGYAYPEWKGSFYPPKIKSEEMLSFYAGHFSAVEINNTFYRMPTEKVLLDWSERVPEKFSFALKAPQKITHYKRLKDAGDELAYFLRTCTVLGDRLGPTLFQLPPGFKKDTETLSAFAASLPRRWNAALEFRHPSWFDEETYDLLRRHNLALCAADTEEEPVRLVPTADFGYLRLRRQSYDDSQLAEWVSRILDQPWRKAFVFFKHEEAGAGPQLAQRFLELARK